MKLSWSIVFQLQMLYHLITGCTSHKCVYSGAKDIRMSKLWIKINV